MDNKLEIVCDFCGKTIPENKELQLMMVATSCGSYTAKDYVEAGNESMRESLKDNAYTTFDCPFCGGEQELPI